MHRVHDQRTGSRQVTVSVILPCYRGAALAERSVEELSRYFELIGLDDWEIVVVDDGGDDFPEGSFESIPKVILLRLPFNQGKGAAVKAGMQIARGHVRVMTDVDLPYGPELVETTVRFLLEHGFHLVIGDRHLPASSYSQELTPGRRLVSSVAASVIGRVVTGGFFDTQCGFKAIRGDVADALFPLLRVDRFAFDVELVYLALYHRLDIKRVPVRLRRNETSTVRVVRDSTRAAVDVLSIKLNQLRGLYEQPLLQEICQVDFERVHGTVARAGEGTPVADL